MDFRSYSAAFYAQNDDILHFGILGMKWGVRRYQNPDGSLTKEGLARYRYNSDTDNYEKIKGRKNVNKRRESIEKLGESLYYNPNDEQKQITRDNKKASEKYYNDVLKKEGFEKSSYGDSVEKTDKDGDIISLTTHNKTTYENQHKSYTEFNKNKAEHKETMFKQAFKNYKESPWDSDKKNLNKLYKELKSSNCYFEFLPQGTIYVMTDGLEGVGYHSFSFEYDPKKKKIIGSVGLEG